jgi:hypothetical protein
MILTEKTICILDVIKQLTSEKTPLILNKHL